MSEPGRIVILNGAPRSGRSSIAAAIQETFEGPWMHLGVGIFSRWVTPPRYRPGIGLEPGAARPEVEALIPSFYAAFYDSVAAHSRHGLNVVVDVGHHEDYSKPLQLLRDAARRLEGLQVLFVGVRCPLEVIMQRRDADAASEGGLHPLWAPGAPIPEEVLGWQDEVHIPGIYDLEVDTATATPAQCAARIYKRLREEPPPSAFIRLAAGA